MFIQTSSKYLFSSGGCTKKHTVGIWSTLDVFVPSYYIICHVYDLMLPSNLRCSHDIMDFVQGIWLFLDVFVPLYMTIRFGIGLFAAWHFSLPHLQLDRIVILFQICFVLFPDKSAVRFFGKHSLHHSTRQAPVVAWGHHCYRCFFSGSKGSARILVGGLLLDSLLAPLLHCGLYLTIFRVCL